MTKKIILIFIVCIFALLTNSSDAKSGTKDVDQLNTRITELQKQMNEMQKKHEAEMKALKKQNDC